MSIEGRGAVAGVVAVVVAAVVVVTADGRALACVVPRGGDLTEAVVVDATAASRATGVSGGNTTASDALGAVTDALGSVDPPGWVVSSVFFVLPSASTTTITVAPARSSTSPIARPTQDPRRGTPATVLETPVCVASGATSCARTSDGAVWLAETAGTGAPVIVGEYAPLPLVAISALSIARASGQR